MPRFTDSPQYFHKYHTGAFVGLPQSDGTVLPLRVCTERDGSRLKFHAIQPDFGITEVWAVWKEIRETLIRYAPRYGFVPAATSAAYLSINPARQWTKGVPTSVVDVRICHSRELARRAYSGTLTAEMVWYLFNPLYLSIPEAIGACLSGQFLARPVDREFALQIPAQDGPLELMYRHLQCVALFDDGQWVLRSGCEPYKETLERRLGVKCQ